MERMSASAAPCAGADVSKDHLDVAVHPGGAARRFANDRAGHTALLRWLGPLAVARVVFEATGPYHRLFERRLHCAGLPFAKVNPRQARRFAEAAGKLAKTDRVDAGAACSRASARSSSPSAGRRAPKRSASSPSSSPRAGRC
jgi:transposase